MKIVVTSKGIKLDSAVDPRFGRAKYFLLIDTETLQATAHDNAQNLNAPQGAGIQAAQAIHDLRADAVVTGHVGPKAFATLAAAGIAVYLGASGTVREAIEQFHGGRLQKAETANVEGHWA
jgi:predicted Fe-Mo cluster-binding NifX family protein